VRSFLYSRQIEGSCFTITEDNDDWRFECTDTIRVPLARFYQSIYTRIGF